MQPKIEKAVLGGGCFWCLDAVYRKVTGVKNVISGYAGGSTKNPTYRDICTGTTGHAEVVSIEYDPDIISYENILEIFWSIHDPTTLNRQGGDIGTQYRSVIFYQNAEQKSQAENSKKEAADSGYFKSPIVTEISPMPEFTEAEDYHQNYYTMNRMANPYCMAVIDPKVMKFVRDHAEFLKEPGGGY